MKVTSCTKLTRYSSFSEINLYIGNIIIFAKNKNQYYQHLSKPFTVTRTHRHCQQRQRCHGFVFCSEIGQFWIGQSLVTSDLLCLHADTDDLKLSKFQTETVITKLLTLITKWAQFPGAGLGLRSQGKCIHIQ